jgi:hypothetical protein
MFGPRFKRCIATLVFTLTLAVWSSNPSAATELEATSIRLIPADAAFYGAMLRNREQIEIIARSNAWKHIVEMPIVQQGLAALQGKLDEGGPQADQFRKVIDNPQAQDLLAMLADMFSDDVFYYGNTAVADTIKLIQQVSNAFNYGGIVLQVIDQESDLNDGQRRGKAALAALAKNLDLMKIPTVIIGYKIEDEDRAKINLGKLEGLLGFATMMQPQLAGSVVRQEVGEDQFLTITLTGKMIPWEAIPLDDLRELDATDGDIDKIVDKITDLQLVIAFGIREGYLMTAVTDSIDQIARLGQGDTLLARPEMEPLKKHGDRRLVGIGYSSQEFVNRIALSAEDLDALLELGDAMLSQVELDESMKGQIRTDATALADEIKQLLPTPGAALRYSFLTDRGVESFLHNWTENHLLIGSKPLALLEHVGGDPLLAIVWREDFRVEHYDRIVHWVKLLHGYFEQFVMPQMDEDDRTKFEQLAEQVGPLCKKFHQVNREKLIPAFEGESALVLDAKLMSTQFCREMPLAEKPMPMVEPAMVTSIADRSLMEQAYEGYQDGLNELVEVLKQFDTKGEIPAEYHIPWPSFMEVEGASVLYYELPEAWGVDQQITPNAALIDNMAVVSASEDHSRRLLEGSSLAAGGVLTDTGRPRAAAVLFDWSGTVHSLAPWVRLAARQATMENLHVDQDDPKVEEVLQQVDTVLEVLQTIRKCTMECTFEQGQVITHSLMEIQDIE